MQRLTRLCQRALRTNVGDVLRIVAAWGCPAPKGCGLLSSTALAGADAALLVFLCSASAQAQNGTWLQNPGSNDFTVASNWSTNSVPYAATFGTSSTTSLTFGGDPDCCDIGSLTFNAGASNYTFNINGSAQIVSLEGSGIVINGGSANIIVGGTSNLEFSGTATAGSANITNNVHLDFLDSSTAGNATITNNLGVRFQNHSTGGTARLINASGGLIDLSLLTNSGMTAGSIEGEGQIHLGSKNLTVGGNNLSTTFSGVLADGGISVGTGGSLTKVGTGTLTLNGNNTYTGATTINGGNLVVNGSIATSSLATVNSGVTLSGTGTVGNTQINSGGTFVPGSLTAGASMTVSGNLTFQPGAIYTVQVNAEGQTSKANVTGNAILGGATLVVQTLANSPPQLQESYFVLTTTGGNVAGTFGGVTLPNYTAVLGYNPNDVVLTVTGAALGAEAGLSGNQRNVANAINSFFNNGGRLTPGHGALFQLTGATLARATSQLTGEAATGAQQGAFQLGNQFMGLMLDPFVEGRGGLVGGGAALGFAPERETLPEDIALAYAKVVKGPVYKAAPPVAFEPRWSAWGGAFGGSNKTEGDPIVTVSHDLSARTAGFAAGMDYRFAPDTVAGFALAGGGTKWDLAQGLGGGRSDAFQAGAYAATGSGPWYLAGALAFAEHWMSTDRFAVFGTHHTADFNAQSFGGRLEGGYRLGTSVAGVTPYAAVQAQSFHTPSYREADLTAGGFGLAYNTRTASDTRAELGARFDYVAAIDRSTLLTLRGRLAWAHDWVSESTLTAAFQMLPGASFIINGAVPAKDAALASAGAELRLANGVTLLAKFDGAFASNAQTYAGTGTVRWTW